MKANCVKDSQKLNNMLNWIYQMRRYLSLLLIILTISLVGIGSKFNKGEGASKSSLYSLTTENSHTHCIPDTDSQPCLHAHCQHANLNSTNLVIPQNSSPFSAIEISFQLSKRTSDRWKPPQGI